MSRQGIITRPYGPDASDPARLVAQLTAVLSIGAGVIHVSAAGDHVELPVMFAGFMIVAILQIGLGALLLRRRPSRLLIAAAVAMMLSSIGLWVLSRTAGLPYLPDGHVEPIGFKDGVTKLFEMASIPGLLLLLSRDLSRVSMPSPRLGSQALTAVGGACLALMVPALLLGGGTHHSHEQAVALGIHDDHHESAEVAHETDSHPPHGVKEAHDAHPSGGHGAGDDAAAGHQHTGIELAGAPLDSLHEHGGTGAPVDSHTHRSGDGNDEVEHHTGKHHDRPHDKQHGGDHGHDHGDGNGSHGEEPGNEDAISVSYEPEPSVCIGGGAVCFP